LAESVLHKILAASAIIAFSQNFLDASIQIHNQMKDINNLSCFRCKMENQSSFKKEPCAASKIFSRDNGS
jgi:hypothetical protein